MKKNYKVNEKVSIVLFNKQIVDGVVLKKEDSILPFIETVYSVKYQTPSRNEYITLVEERDIYPRQNPQDW